MAELERIANHLGDIGAICNDAAFALMHAHCGVLRERVLRAADACFGHRLMMDRIVPGGVAADLGADGSAQLSQAPDRRVRRRFPELVELYDNTASLQDRTVGTGRARARAGPPVRRRRPRRPRRRAAPSMPAGRPGYPPYDELEFEVPVLQRERRQRPGLDPHPRGRAEPGADRADPRAAAGRRRCGSSVPRRRPARAWRWSRRFRGDVLVVAAARRRRARRSAATCAIRPGSSGRCSRPRSRATSSPTSRSATNRSTAPTRATTSRAMRRTLLLEPVPARR